MSASCLIRADRVPLPSRALLTASRCMEADGTPIYRAPSCRQRAVHMMEPDPEQDADWQSHWATLTFAVE